jgi:hypothetical protein
MKKIFILIGLIGCLGLNAQLYTWELSYNGNDITGSDSIYYGKSNEDWNNLFVTINVCVQYLEDIDAAMYFGGQSKILRRLTGSYVPNWYSSDDIGVNIGPLVADTAGTIFKPNYDSTWYCVTLIDKDFGFTNPAFWYVKNSTDSCEVRVVFEANRDR